MITVLATPAALGDDRLSVDGDAYRHLFRAARAAVGDAVRVVDGKGRARHAMVERVERRRAILRLGGEAPSLELGLRLELVVAPPRPSRASWLVEKGTELGVAAFRFIECERSERSLDTADLERLSRVAASAVEQCGRAWLPELSGGHSLEERLAGAGAATSILLDPAAAVSLHRLAPMVDQRMVMVVGPEGGFTSPEIESAIRLGALPMRLGPSLLRVETAALAAAAWALLQYGS